MRFQGEARALWVLAWMWAEPDLDRAEEIASRGVGLAEGPDFEVGHLHEAWGMFRCLRGDYRTAAEHLSSAVRRLHIQRNCAAHVLETCAAWMATHLD